MLSNNEALDLLRNISRIISTGSKSTKFNFALIRNMRKLEVIQKAAQDTLNRESDPVYDELMEALLEVKKEFAQLNGNGEPIMTGEGEPFIDPTKIPLYEARAKSISDTNPAWQEAYKRRQGIVKDILEADSGFNPFMIKQEVLPEDLSGIDLIQLTPLLEGLEE